MTFTDQYEARRAVAGLPKGPVALILNEDDVDLGATVAHHRTQGFAAVVVVGSADTSGHGADVVLAADVKASLADVVNELMPVLPGRWVFAGHNAEYLFYPFCESRTISDVTQFISEERREAVFCTTVDIYSDTPGLAETGLSESDAYFDRAGYFALDKYDGPTKLTRQVDLFGGLKWRYSEHIPWERQKINRVALFRGRPGLEMLSDHSFNDPEMNTINCEWHNSLTCAVASLRVAKSLLRNPGSTFDVDRFVWSQSEKFEWRSQQLMDHGLLEPGQWF